MSSGRSGRTGVAVLPLSVLVLIGCSPNTARADCQSGTYRGFVSASRDLKVAPTISATIDKPPCRVQYQDVVEGTGAAVGKHSVVEIRYVLFDIDGKSLDSTWTDNNPVYVPLGTGQGIKGFDSGLAGMREGGRREVIVPADQGYGAETVGPIKPNSTLVFVVDLISANAKPPAG